MVPSLGSGSMAHMGMFPPGWSGVEGGSKGRGGAGGGGGVVRTLAAVSRRFSERGYLPWPSPSPGGYM